VPTPKRAPRLVALGVEAGDDRLDAQRAGGAAAAGVEAEDQADELRFDGIDLELLLDPGAALFHLESAVAERDRRAVVEALAGVLLHGAEHVLGVLAALVLVEKRDDLPHHDLPGIVAELLGDGDEPDADLGEAADIHFEPEGVAEEAAVRVHDDDVVGVIVVEGAVDHPLQLGAVVVGRRGARLDVLADEGPTFGATCGSGRRRCRRGR
jgi:hypothetical protein